MPPALLWTFGLIGLAALVALAYNVLIIVFAALVFAAGLRGATLWLARRTGLGYRVALVSVCLFIAALLAAGGVSMGVELTRQMRGFEERVQTAAERSATWLEERRWGQFLLDRLDGANNQGSPDAILAGIQTFTAGLVTVVMGFGLIVVLAVFFAADARGYERGIEQCLPSPYRERAEDLFERWATALRAWMFGQMISMIFLAASTFLILKVLGVPQALIVSLFVGVLTFIPYLGPAIGLVPVVLVASTQGAQTLVWVLILYLIVQNIEGNVLMPLVQRQVIHVRPAILLTTQLVMGTLFGIGGVLIAAPLAAVGYATLDSFEARPSVRTTTARNTAQQTRRPREAGVQRSV